MSALSSRPSTPLGTPRSTDPRTTSHPAHRLLSRAYGDPEGATKIFTDKLLNKPLLLSTSAPMNDRAVRRRIRDRKKAYARKHSRPKPLSAKEKRDLGLYTLRPSECKYAVYKGLNTLWRRYVLELLGYVDREGRVVEGRVGSAVSAAGAGSLLASADYHGMEVEVVRCMDAGRVGLRGIVVRETRSTFTIVCDEREEGRRKRKVLASNDDREVDDAGGLQLDKVRMILKKGSVFQVRIDLPMKDEVSRDEPGKSSDFKVQADARVSTQTPKTKRQLLLELHGDQLEVRPIERAVKKFKWKPMDYL